MSILDKHNPQHKKPTNNNVFYVILAVVIIVTVFLRWPIIPKTLGALALNLLCIGGFWWIVITTIHWWNFRKGMKNMGQFGERNSKK